MGKRLVDLIARVAAVVLEADRARIALLMVACGAFLLGLSSALGLADIPTLPGGIRHQVGYLAAPNWTAPTLLLTPLMFYTMRCVIDSAERAFADIDCSPMVWLARDANRNAVFATWEANKRLLRIIVPVGFVAALAASLAQWAVQSALPLYHGYMPANLHKMDWSNVAAWPGSAGHTWWSFGNGAFAFLAFFYQSVNVTIMLTFAASTVLIARTMALHGTGDANPALLVDIGSNDPAKRLGFERFIIVIDYMIGFVGLAFVNFFLTRIQNAYLTSDLYASLGQFIRQDLTVSPDRGLPQVVTTLFSSNLDDYSSIAVSIAAVVVLFQCFFFFNATLRHTATLARNRSDRALATGRLKTKAAAIGLDQAAVRERLQSANVWPLGYSDLLPTLSFLTICVCTIVFYRIGVYLVFLWIVGWIVSRSAAGLLRGLLN
jgi:hypothetical protein